MTRRRWIADEFSEHHATLLGDHASHLSRALRVLVGQEFEVACGDIVRRATVSSVSADRVEFALGEEVSATVVTPITLLLAVFKFDRMEWAIEKCTELNVARIVPVIARRTEKHLALAAEKRVERWRRVAREASEQSRRIAPPEIADPMKLKDLLKSAGHEVINSPESPKMGRDTRGAAPSQDNHSKANSVFQGSRGEDSSTFDREEIHERYENQPHGGGTEVSPGRKPWVHVPNGLSPVGTAQTRAEDSTLHALKVSGAHLRILLAETERDLMLTDILRAHPDTQSLTLAVGPEGGWTPEELKLFTDSHWLPASLGDTILRAETAAIAALAIARAEV